ncbi:hypothetical protein VI06_09990 [Aquitalea magnusonii]|nr:hypothetical protein VI06_09990 [Aquitalea magnusonii]
MAQADPAATAHGMRVDGCVLPYVQAHTGYAVCCDQGWRCLCPGGTILCVSPGFSSIAADIIQ